MPDANVATLGRADSIPNNGNATPTIKLTTTTSNTQRNGRTAPGINLEHIYVELKKLVGDHWSTYKDAFGQFMLGLMSLEEFNRTIHHFILVEPIRENLHNQLLVAVYTNVQRNVPEEGIASWVSSTEKVTSVLKHVSGDAAAQRLRTEVMQLPPRVRARLKGINDDPPQRLVHSLSLAREVSQIHPNSGTPSLVPSTSNSANPSGNLNKDLDIRRRYNLPLASESHDIPHPSILTERITPICYEEGLPYGPQNPEPCIDLLSISLETFVKEVIVSILDRTMTNAPISGPPPPIIAVAVGGSDLTTTAALAPLLPPSVSLTGAAVGITSGPSVGILTASYSRRLSSEARAVVRGEIKRTDTGLLPVEVESMARQRELDAASMGLADLDEAEDLAKIESLVGVPADLRLAWQMGEQYLRGMTPWWGEKMLGIDDFTGDTAQRMVNGDVEAMDVDADPAEAMDWQWQGAGAADRGALGALLDDCLAVKQ